MQTGGGGGGGGVGTRLEGEGKVCFCGYKTFDRIMHCVESYVCVCHNLCHPPSINPLQVDWEPSHEKSPPLPEIPNACMSNVHT